MSAVVILKNLNCFKKFINGVRVDQCYFEWVFNATIQKIAHILDGQQFNIPLIGLSRIVIVLNGNTMHIPLNG